MMLQLLFKGLYLEYFGIALFIMISIILHELAHGWAALWQGDQTPRAMQRMTLDPMVHMGGFSLLMLFTIGIAFGAMPVNPHNFRSRYGHAYVAFAGPAMNFFLVFFFLGALKLLTSITSEQQSLEFLLWYAALLNFVLMVFNMLPVPPLDGFTVFANLSSSFRRFAQNSFFQQYGFLLIILLVWVGPLGDVMFTYSANFVNFVAKDLLGVK